MKQESEPIRLNNLAEKIVETPLGSIKVILATKDQLEAMGKPGFSPNAALLETVTSKGLLANYLTRFGQDPNPIEPRKGYDDYIPSPNLLPPIKPIDFTVLHCITSKGNPLFLFGVVTYQILQQEQWSEVKRVVFLRPDAGTSLVILGNKDTGKKYVVLNRGWKDGVGAPFSAEASAGTADRPSRENLLSLALREVTEEIGITEEELQQAIIDTAYEPKTASPGGTPEKIGGFLVQLEISSDKINTLKSHLAGADEHEVIQQILLELPDPNIVRDRNSFGKFKTSWQSLLDMTLDQKTHLLLQTLYLKQQEKIIQSLLPSSI